MNSVKILLLVLFLIGVFQTVNPEILGFNSDSVKQVTGTNLENKTSNLSDCVKVSISGSASVMIEDRSFMITIVIENRSKEKISLTSFPIVYLQKAGVEDDKKDVWGNLFYTITKLPDDSEFVKKDFLEPDEKIEFDVDITKSSWGHSRQSLLPSSNIFALAPEGEYGLYVKLPFYYSENGKQKLKNSISNSVQVSVDIDYQKRLKIFDSSR